MLDTVISQSHDSQLIDVRPSVQICMLAWRLNYMAWYFTVDTLTLALKSISY